MSSISSIASSGLYAAQLQLDASAHNVANQQTPGFKRQTVEQQAAADQGGVQSRVEQALQEGTALEADMVNQIAATYAFAANLLVVRTDDRMKGTLLDEQA